MRNLLIAALLLLAATGGARAEPISGKVYASCPVALGWTVGTFQFLALDAGGNVCTSGSGSGTSGQALTSADLGGTIAVTNTFQSIQVSTAGRKGCLIQNNSGTTDDQWIYVGPIGSATKGHAYRVSPGGSFGCSQPNGVITDQLSITGTATDTFAATVQ